jgi:hypothetical protein
MFDLNRFYGGVAMRALMLGATLAFLSGAAPAAAQRSAPELSDQQQRRMVQQYGDGLKAATRAVAQVCAEFSGRLRCKVSGPDDFSPSVSVSVRPMTRRSLWTPIGQHKRTATLRKKPIGFCILNFFS